MPFTLTWELGSLRLGSEGEYKRQKSLLTGQSVVGKYSGTQMALSGWLVASAGVIVSTKMAVGGGAFLMRCSISASPLRTNVQLYQSQSLSWTGCPTDFWSVSNSYSFHNLCVCSHKQQKWLDFVSTTLRYTKKLTFISGHRLCSPESRLWEGYWHVGNLLENVSGSSTKIRELVGAGSMIFIIIWQ